MSFDFATRCGLGALALGAIAAAAAGACGSRSELRAKGTGTVGQGGVGGEGGGVPSCVVHNSSAELAPLDVFMLLDTSGSMGQPTQDGQIKWYAVTNALTSFFYDMESSGIGVALTFFPIIDELVPEQCTQPSDCGMDPTLCEPLNVCPSSFQTSVVTCDTDEDCDAAGFPDDACEPLGVCTGDTFTYCQETAGLPCAGSTGPCIDVGFCENRFTCEAEAYETPAEDVAPLPSSAASLVQTLNNQSLVGGTPTLPGLTGVAAHAVQFANDNPAHKVIVVAATDGFPTVCDPALDNEDPNDDVAGLVQVASDSLAAGVQTFVVGVFTPEEAEEAQLNLDLIAQAGGSESAFVITTGVAAEFLEALNTVRLDAKSCEFELAESEEPLDFSEVYVRLTPANGEPVWVTRVDSEAQCDAVDGGFYYDLPPNGPTPPSKVILCPASCTLLGSSPNRIVEIYTACPDPTES